MKVQILRSPGLDLLHDLKAKGVAIPLDCVEGQVRSMNQAEAQTLIELGVAKPADDGVLPQPHKTDAADKPAPSTPHETPAGATQKQAGKS